MTADAAGSSESYSEAPTLAIIIMAGIIGLPYCLYRTTPLSPCRQSKDDSTKAPVLPGSSVEDHREAELSYINHSLILFSLSPH